MFTSLPPWSPSCILPYLKDDVEQMHSIIWPTLGVILLSPPSLSPSSVRHKEPERTHAYGASSGENQHHLLLLLLPPLPLPHLSSSSSSSYSSLLLHLFFLLRPVTKRVCVCVCPHRCTWRSHALTSYAPRRLWGESVYLLFIYTFLRERAV